MKPKKSRLTTEEGLELLRQMHEAGDPLAARKALFWVAAGNLSENVKRHDPQLPIPLPEWLAIVIMKAIQTSNEGKADSVLGFGNKKMLALWRKQFRQDRNRSIAASVDHAYLINKKRGIRVSKTQIIEKVAGKLGVSIKTVEPLVYRPKNKNTARPKK